MSKEDKPLEYQRRIRDTKGVAQRLDLGYLRRPALLLLLRQRLTWALLAVAAAASVPIVLGIGGGRRLVENGPLSEAHAIFEKRCEVCHTQNFGGVPDKACQSCHQQSGLVAMARLGRVGYHDAFPNFSLGHGQAARQTLESCVACHAERDCTVCHSAVNGGFRFSPHGPGFNPDRMCEQLYEALASAGASCRVAKVQPNDIMSSGELG